MTEIVRVGKGWVMNQAQKFSARCKMHDVQMVSNLLIADGCRR